jgi:L-alanine-DL-glutamate epimerase-like enolase superfamily enzyme
LGQIRAAVPIYGSGGFTSYSIAALQEQLVNWTDKGITRIKMKIGREPEKDVSRVTAVRQAIGPANELFVDANGVYSCKQALAMAGIKA